MSDTAVRTPHQVFDHHVQALVARDLEGIVEDYADDAVFITPDGALRGKDGSARRSRRSSTTCRMRNSI